MDQKQLGKNILTEHFKTYKEYKKEVNDMEKNSNYSSEHLQIKLFEIKSFIELLETKMKNIYKLINNNSFSISSRVFKANIASLESTFNKINKKISKLKKLRESSNNNNNNNNMNSEMKEMAVEHEREEAEAEAAEEKAKASKITFNRLTGRTTTRAPPNNEAGKRGGYKTRRKRRGNNK